MQKKTQKQNSIDFQQHTETSLVHEKKNHLRMKK